MQSDVRDTEQQDITSGVNMPGDFIAKSISTEDDVTAGKTSQIDRTDLLVLLLVRSLVIAMICRKLPSEMNCFRCIERMSSRQSRV